MMEYCYFVVNQISRGKTASFQINVKDDETTEVLSMINGYISGQNLVAHIETSDNVINIGFRGIKSEQLDDFIDFFMMIDQTIIENHNMSDSDIEIE